ncbi:MAG: hypothetical protein FD129_246 [bacterium]|nr:MAG: hypothetical protein FD129_246 [bacterium]
MSHRRRIDPMMVLLALAALLAPACGRGADSGAATGKTGPAGADSGASSGLRRYYLRPADLPWPAPKGTS